MREHGISAGLEWYLVADAAVVYRDRGISSGMRQGIARAQTYGVDVEYRNIGDLTVGSDTAREVEQPRRPSAFVTALLRVFG